MASLTFTFYTSIYFKLYCNCGCIDKYRQTTIITIFHELNFLFFTHWTYKVDHGRIAVPSFAGISSAPDPKGHFAGTISALTNAQSVSTFIGST